MDKGSLEFMSNRDIKVSEAVMAAITFQIIWGLGYLHFENQIHRDVKPANILMVSIMYVYVLSQSETMRDVHACIHTYIYIHTYILAY